MRSEEIANAGAQVPCAGIGGLAESGATHHLLTCSTIHLLSRPQPQYWLRTWVTLPYPDIGRATPTNLTCPSIATNYLSLLHLFTCSTIHLFSRPSAAPLLHNPLDMADNLSIRSILFTV